VIATDPHQAERLAAELTALLRTPNGTMSLRPLQARALAAADSVGGLFCSAAVGVGKTLIAALAMTVVGGDRPIMFTSGGKTMVDKTNDEFAALRMHWRLPTGGYRVEPYEKLGMAAYANLLDELQPTCVILDEAHKLRHVDDSGRARRMGRWRAEHPDVPVIALSGSPGAKVVEFAHLLWWTLGDAAADLLPPLGSAELKAFCDEVETDDEAKAEFHAALARLPGVVMSPETYRETPLDITHHIAVPPDELEEHFAQLRDFAEAPDGWALDGPSEVWTLERCLSNGFYYEHVPRPPDDYRAAWKAWARFCRDAIKDSRAPGGPYDTPGQVVQAVEAGKLPLGAPLLRDWLAIKPTYTPEKRTEWLSTFALEWAEERARELATTSGGTIVWTGQTGFGVELARRTGWPYYGSGARDSKGRSVKNARAPIIICSVKACGTGYNLQYVYSKNVVVNPFSNNDWSEQTIGRTHRSGQKQARVQVEMFHSCIADYAAIRKAEREALSAAILHSTEQKLSLAQTTWTSDVPDASVHSAWRAAAKQAEVTVDIDE
jgi:hypothetical protein